MYKNLEDCGIIKEWKESGKKPGKSLSLVFDNCGGQDKNHVMLRMNIVKFQVEMLVTNQKIDIGGRVTKVLTS